MVYDTSIRKRCSTGKGVDLEMGKANYSRRKKLQINILRSDLSASDKLTCYAMLFKYVDGEQLLEYLESSPTLEQVREYVEQKLEENRVKRKGAEK